MHKQIVSTAAAIIAVLTFTPAQANDSENLKSCRIAVADEAGVEVGKVQFRSLRGTISQRFRFDVRVGENERTVECKVRKSEIVEITWK